MGKKSMIGLVSVAIVVVSILLAQDSSRLFLDMSGGSGSYTYNVLFNSGLGIIIGAVGLGLLLGSIAGGASRPQTSGDKIGIGSLLDDWGIALSSLGALILLVSGIFLGGTWSPRLVSSVEANGFVLNMHFFGMVTLLFGVCYIAMYMIFSKSIGQFSSITELLNWGGGSRYLPSHKMAMLTFLVVVLALVVKGAGLIAVHGFGWPEGIAVGTSVFHDIAALVALVLLAAAVVLWVLEKLTAQEEVVSKPSQAAV